MSEEPMHLEPEESPAPQTEEEAAAVELPELVEKPPENPALQPETAEPQKEQQKHSWFYRLLDPSTRFGRFMRAALRILAAIVGLFALGLLSGYLLLYRPLLLQYDTRQLDLNTVQQSLSDTQSQLSAAQSDNSDLQSDLQRSQSDLEDAHTTIDYLVLKADLLKARLSLMQEAGGPDAMAALKDAKRDLDILLPAVNQIDPNLANLLSSRLDVVIEELIRDPTVAASELDELYTRLLDLEDSFVN
jgi:hypothetical protein